MATQTGKRLQKELEEYLQKYGGETQSIEQIIEAGLAPKLAGFTVIPGKVSSSIVGGKGFYYTGEGDSKKKVEFENPSLIDKDGNNTRLMVRSGWLSTHDIKRGIVPFKDQMLAYNHNFMRKMLQLWMPHAQIECGLSDLSPVSAQQNLDRFPIENVVRLGAAKSTTSTSLYVHHFVNGEQTFCGIDLSRYKGQLNADELLPFPMDTPSTKDSVHDASVAPEVLYGKDFDENDYRHIRNQLILACGIVAGWMYQRGVLLVDTKTEHGRDPLTQIIKAIDELFTLDSTRYYKLVDGKILREGDEAVSFSKEFARGVSKGSDPYTQEQCNMIAERYIESIDLVTGTTFVPEILSWEERVVRDVNTCMRNLQI